MRARTAMIDKSSSYKPRDVNGEKPPAITRRDAIVVAGAALLATSVPLLGQTTVPSSPGIPPDPTKLQGRVPTDLGQRSTFENPRRLVFRALPSGETGTPLQHLRGIVTPSDLHFERHHGGIPSIDPAKYTLLIHGMCERPLKFSLDDLKRFPSVSRIHFIE